MTVTVCLLISQHVLPPVCELAARFAWAMSRNFIEQFHIPSCWDKEGKALSLINDYYNIIYSWEKLETKYKSKAR